MSDMSRIISSDSIQTLKAFAQTLDRTFSLFGTVNMTHRERLLTFRWKWRYHIVSETERGV